MKRFKAVIVKELIHIIRDRRSLMVVFAMPVMMIFLYGSAITFDLREIKISILDFCQSRESRILVKAFVNNRIFTYRLPQRKGRRGDAVAEAETMLLKGEIDEYLVIPADFSRRLWGRRGASLGSVIDGSDANRANLIFQYNEQIYRQFLERFGGVVLPLQIHTHIFFNPEGKSQFFFIPGIVAILLMMISGLLTAISLSREKESGSIDLLFISPLRSWEIIVGKTIPYMGVALITGSLVLLFARFWFGIPIRGNPLVLLFFSILYIFCGLALGMLVSTKASSQRIAMLGSLLITMLPSIMLSGFIYPLESLPGVIRGVAQLVPATYFLRIIRGVVIKEASIRHFIWEGVMLVVLSLILIAAATLQFTRMRKQKI